MQADVTALILCGGRGERMGGADKPLLEWHGKPMVEHVVEAVRAVAGEVLISANRNVARYQRWAPVITDHPYESSGPLTGILRGMETARHSKLWVCPGDAPALSEALLSRLDTTDAQVVTAHDGQRDQWLHMLTNVSLREHLAGYIEAGGYSVYRWIESLPANAHARVDVADEAGWFLNINSPERLSRS